MPNKYKPNRRWPLWWLDKQLETSKLLIERDPTTSDGLRVRQSGTTNHPLSVQICPCNAKQRQQQCVGAAHGCWSLGRRSQESQSDHDIHNTSTGIRVPSLPTLAVSRATGDNIPGFSGMDTESQETIKKNFSHVLTEKRRLVKDYEASKNYAKHKAVNLANGQTGLT